MAQLILQHWVLDAIKVNPALFSDIATLLKVSIYTMPKLVRENDPRLTQATVLKLIKVSLKVSNDSDLLTEDNGEACGIGGKHHPSRP